MSENNLEYHFRDIALLCIAFDLTDKGNRPVNINKVEEEIGKKFPKLKKEFSSLLQASMLMGSVLIRNGDITITEIGIKTAQQRCGSIRKNIAIRQKPIN